MLLFTHSILLLVRVRPSRNPLHLATPIVVFRQTLLMFSVWQWAYTLLVLFLATTVMSSFSSVVSCTVHLLPIPIAWRGELLVFSATARVSSMLLMLNVRVSTSLRLQPTTLFSRMCYRLLA